MLHMAKIANPLLKFIARSMGEMTPRSRAQGEYVAGDDTSRHG